VASSQYSHSTGPTSKACGMVYKAFVVRRVVSITSFRCYTNESVEQSLRPVVTRASWGRWLIRRSSPYEGMLECASYFARAAVWAARNMDLGCHII
jgi:hypothetical protein